MRPGTISTGSALKAKQLGRRSLAFVERDKDEITGVVCNVERRCEMPAICSANIARLLHDYDLRTQEALGKDPRYRA
jgi:hypothetical protein